MQVVLDDRQVIGVSDECADSIFKIFRLGLMDPEDVGITVLWNADNFSLANMG